MNIFGLSGAMDPFEIEKLFINQEISIYHLDGNLYEQEYFDDNDFKITKYNPKTEMNEEISLSNIEPSTYKTVLYIIKILKENSQQDLTVQIIKCFYNIINKLEQKDEKLAEIILPTIIQIIPQVDAGCQITLFSCIYTIMKHFKNVIKNNLSDLVQLSKNFIIIEQCSKLCFSIFTFLFENFVYEMEIYYPILIPIFLSFFNFKNKKR
jgi:hypothetical protein